MAGPPIDRIRLQVTILPVLGIAAWLAVGKVGLGFLAVVLALVPLHRELDGLLVVTAQGRQSVGVDEHFDAAGDARLSSDEPGALKHEDHLVDGRRADMESALQIGFGRRPTDHLSIGVDKG